MSEQETKISETQLDIDEMNNLLKLVTRSHVKQLLTQEIQKLSTTSSSCLSTPIANPEPSQPQPSQAEPITKVVTKSNKYYKDITNYAWDQSDKFMKIYVTIEGVHKLPKESVFAEYSPKSFLLKVENLNNQNFKCHVAYLYENIVPRECYHKVKTDTVLLMLKKDKIKTWAYVVQKEDNKKTPKFDDKKDPNESLMDLMKKLYDEGDDEMKRTIAKSFSESRNKVAAGEME